MESVPLPQQASRAVRSRIDIVRSLVSSVISRATSPKRFLDVASGPGRIERKVIDQLGSPHSAVHFDLVDADADAIEYSRALSLTKCHLATPSSSITATHFVLRTISWHTMPFGVAVFFDYLDERRAVRLLAKMYSWLGEGGTMLIGNFAKECTTQWIMEGLYGWSLIYRTNDECEQLCWPGIPSGSATLEQRRDVSTVL
ncbi:MAG: class I SAM-dependent methyltransferase [Ignavibacteria bacterium]|nr:class I SAM-dependent methyltransferase [Ignavibacteria bacterium]